QAQPDLLVEHRERQLVRGAVLRRQQVADHGAVLQGGEGVTDARRDVDGRGGPGGQLHRVPAGERRRPHAQVHHHVQGPPGRAVDVLGGAGRGERVVDAAHHAAPGDVPAGLGDGEQRPPDRGGEGPLLVRGREVAPLVVEDVRVEHVRAGHGELSVPHGDQAATRRTSGTYRIQRPPAS